MKRFLKVLLVAGALVLLVGLGSMTWMVSRLPSRGEVAGMVKGASKALAPPTAPAPEVAASPSPEKGAAPSATEKDKGSQGLAMIHALMQEDPRDVRVCSNLGHSRLEVHNPDASLSFDQALGPERDDSVAEAFRAPLRAIFQDPAVSSLIQEIEGLESSVHDKSREEREGFFEKIGFYSRVAGAAAALYTRRDHFEALGNRAQDLSVIARLALLKPELKDSSRLTDFCRALENFDTAVDQDSIMRERKELLALIADQGLKPADVGFDPDEWIKFTMEAGKDGFNFSLKGKADQNKAHP